MSWAEHRRKEGFTLAEILMVCLIIGIITAIVLPSFRQQQAQTDINFTKANLESIRMAIELYYDQEGQWPNASLSDLYDATSPSTNVYIGVMPKEGIMDSNIVEATPMYDGGWYWDTGNHVVVPDLTGMDANGDPYSNY